MLNDNPPARFVRANGEAVVTAKPDRAQISIAVVSQGATAQAAAAANFTHTAQIVDSLKRALGMGGEIKTVGYSLAPQYQTSTTRAAKITGYQAVNTVLVIVDDLAFLGKIMDAASDLGANNINAISFSLKDDHAPRAQALAQAAGQAKAAAEAIAKSLGLAVLGVWQAETALLTSSPVEAGDLQIRAHVTVTLEIQ